MEFYCAKETRRYRKVEGVHVAAEVKKVPVYGFKNPKILVLVSNDMQNPDGCQDASSWLLWDWFCVAESVDDTARNGAGEISVGCIWNPGEPCSVGDGCYGGCGE